jgi:hypothetical protein
MAPADLADISQRLVNALENVPAQLDPSSLGDALAALAERMSVAEAAPLVGRGAESLMKPLENPEAFEFSVWRLGNPLIRLAARTKETDARQFALRLVKFVITSQGLSSERLSAMGIALLGFSQRLSATRHTELFALSSALAVSVPDSEEGSFDNNLRKWVEQSCARSSTAELAEMLKWPFTVGEAQKIVLAELEKKTGRKFGGDMWKFVAQAEELGIENIDAPAKRPRVEDALAELEALSAAETGRGSGGAPEARPN